MQKNKSSSLANFCLEELENINGVKFTPREIDIIACILNRRATKKIASFLKISQRTVETHTRNIMLKLECNSQEGIIDFVEKSNQFSLVKKYYLNLLIQTVFEQRLKEISNVVDKSKNHCSVVYSKQYGNNTAFIQQLEKHLIIAGINPRIVFAEEVNSSFNPTELGGRTIYIVPEHSENNSQIIGLLQSTLRSPNSSLFLLFNKKTLSDIIQKLPSNNVIYITEPKNYYFNFFEILEKLYPTSISFNKIISEFKTYFEQIYHSSEISSHQQLINFDKPLEKPLNTGEFIPPLKERRKVLFIGASIFCLSVTCLSLFLLLKNTTTDARQQNSPDKMESIRSDMRVPVDDAILKRTELLVQIEKRIAEQDGIKSVVLVGSGGTGKTTLARQFGQLQDGVVWEINAETKESFVNSFNDLAYVLTKNSTQKNELEFIQKIQTPEEREKRLIYFVKQCLKQTQNWLLIYDNVVVFSDIKSYFPHDPQVWGNGKVIITTQDSNIKNTTYIKPENVIQIGELNQLEALTLFSKAFFNCEPIQIPEEQRNRTLAFLKHIPPFPLDVSIAAYYIKNAKITYDDYLKSISLHSSSFEEVQKNLLKEVSDYAKTRYGIIILSFSKLIEANSEFKDLLLLMCFIDSQYVPKAFLEFYKGKEVADSFVHHLRKYSLITSELSAVDNKIPHTLFLHRSTQTLGQAFLLSMLNEEEKIRFLDKIIDLVKSYCKINEGDNYSNVVLLIPHLETLLKNIRTSSFAQEIKEKYERELLLIIGYAHLKCSRIILAKKFLSEALRVGDSSKHFSKSELAIILRDLGHVSVELSDFDEALAFSQESIKLCNESMPNSEELIAENLIYIGYAYAFKNQFKEAKQCGEAILSKIPKIRKKEIESRAYALLAFLYSVTYVNGKKAYEAVNYAHKALESVNGLQLFYNNHNEAQKVNYSLIIKHKRTLGRAFCRLGQYKEAAAQGFKEIQYIVDHVLNGNANDLIKIELLLGMGEVFLREGNLKAAKEQLSESIKRSEQLVGENFILPARIFRAETHIRLGEYEAAFKDCEFVFNIERKSKTNYSDLMYLTCFYHAAIVKYKENKINDSMKYFSEFFKRAKTFSKTFLDEKAFSELEAQGEFNDAAFDVNKTPNIDDCLKRSATIFSEIYGLSHPFVKDYASKNCTYVKLADKTHLDETPLMCEAPL